MENFLYPIFLFVFGSSIGSFLNVYRYRYPKSISVIYPRSFCPKCKNKIPSTACLAIAGSIKNNSAKITNLNQEISHKYIKRKYNFQNLELINDFSVLIYGIPFISNNQYAIIQQGNKLIESNNKLHAVIGAGTGLGVARGIIDADKISVLSSEGGHSEFSPRSTEEWELKEWLQKYLNLERKIQSS